MGHCWWLLSSGHHLSLFSRRHFPRPIWLEWEEHHHIEKKFKRIVFLLTNAIFWSISKCIWIINDINSPFSKANLVIVHSWSQITIFISLLVCICEVYIRMKRNALSVPLLLLVHFTVSCILPKRQKSKLFLQTFQCKLAK